jgi:uncharacterized membrane protein HdeD (DUF308 family)
MFLYDDNNNYRESFRQYWNSHVKKFRTYSLIAGIIMVVLGILCMVYPVTTMVVIEVLASIVLLAVGITELVSYFQTPVYIRFSGGLLNGILNVMLGIMLLTSPKEALLASYAWLFAIAMLMFGISELGMASRARFFGMTDTGSLTAGGVLSIIFAIILFFLPQASIAVSYIIGLYLIVAGVNSLINAINAKEMKM